MQTNDEMNRNHGGGCRRPVSGRRAGLLVVLAGLLVVLAVGCSGGIRGNQPIDSDYVMIAGVTDGTELAKLNLNVQCPAFVTVDFTVNVEFAAVSGGAGPVRPPTQNDLYQVTGYTVSYKDKATGGSVVGVHVPPGIGFTPITMQAQLVPAEFAIENAPVLGQAQKTALPLNDPDNIPKTLIATVRVFGRPLSDPNMLAFAAFDYELGFNRSDGFDPLCP